MKIVKRLLGKTTDISSARDTAISEIGRLLLFVTILAMGLYFAVSLLVDVAVSKISIETEAKLFSYSFLIRSPKKTDDERLQQANLVLDVLTKNETVVPFAYRLIAIDDKKPNAFAFPGGTIGVTTGLLDILREDIELAFVLGHELGHFKNRDHLRGMGRAVGVSIGYALLFSGEMGGNSVSNVFHYVLQRNYSRQQEDRADNFGVNLVFQVYGKTDGIEKLFKILQNEKDIPEWAYMFATHPSPADRISNLRKYADEIISSGK